MTDYVLTANEIDADPTVFRRKPSDVVRTHAVPSQPPAPRNPSFDPALDDSWKVRRGSGYSRSGNSSSGVARIPRSSPP
jgi:hypothetical protein